MKQTSGQITVIDEFRERPRTAAATANPSGTPVLPGGRVCGNPPLSLVWDNPANNPLLGRVNPNWRKTLSVTTLATFVILGLLVGCSGPYAQAATPDAPVRFSGSTNL